VRPATSQFDARKSNVRLTRAVAVIGAAGLLVLSGSQSVHARPLQTYVVVFESARLGGHSQIYTVAPSRNQKPRRSLTPSAANQTSPTVSAQTGELAISSDEGTRWQIYVLGAGGVRHAVGSPDRTNADPAWSPDGDRIAFESNHGGNWDIDIASPDGSQLQRLTRSPRTDMDPAWSPDGSKIVFTRIAGKGSDIFVIDVYSRALRRVTRTPAPEFDPNWSPDGTSIVFDRVVGGDYDLWTMTPAGKKQRRLTRGSGNDVDPVWSPDSKRVAFQSDRTGNYEIFVVNADGSGLLDVSNTPTALDVEPSWRKTTTSTAATRTRNLAGGGYACTRASKTEQLGSKTVIYGTNEVDFLCGEAGQDVLLAGRGRDYVDGGNGNDKIYGGLDGDYILAQDGSKDRLFGGRTDYDDSKLDRAWMDRYKNKKGDVNVKNSVDVISP
jgi:Tol biopolymer transport system component